MVENHDPQLRREALNALAPFGEDVTLPNDEDKHVRLRALELLAPLGKRALPGIVEGLRDDDIMVAGTALEALVKIAPETLTNTTVLALGAEGLKSTGERRYWAGRLLRAAGQQSLGEMPICVYNR